LTAVSGGLRSGPFFHLGLGADSDSRGRDVNASGAVARRARRKESS
jgi:hypothetical protein